MFIVRKYILAISAKQAIALERNSPVYDVWVDDEWKKNNAEKTQVIGFDVAEAKSNGKNNQARRR